MSLILTTAIEKGGTGKTTTVVNLAALMAAEGKRVLVVDYAKVTVLNPNLCPRYAQGL